MNELVIVSAEPRAGKSMLAACFAALSQNAVLADCDLRGRGLPQIVECTRESQAEYVAGRGAHIAAEQCVGCGRCVQTCDYDAISLSGPANDFVGKTYRVDSQRCQGCRVCGQACPRDGFVFEPATKGFWYVARTPHAPLIHALCDIPAEDAGKWVAMLRRQARLEADQRGRDLVIVDGPSGLHCPTIEALVDATLVLVVAEPKVTNLLPFGRLLEATQHFSRPVVACINRWDVNPDIARRLQTVAAAKGVSILGKLPHDPVVPEMERRRRSVVEQTNERLGADVRGLWSAVAAELSCSLPPLSVERAIVPMESEQPRGGMA